MQRVFVVDKNRNPLMPCYPARARKLLRKGRARVLRKYPFTIILLDREGGHTQETQVKVDPGAKTTGIAVVAAFKRGKRCIWALDAVCVGESGEQVYVSPNHKPLTIQATGRQSRQMCRVDKYGFPRTKAKQNRVNYGFQTGDIVKAIVPKGKAKGVHIGRVAVRTRKSFRLNGYDINPDYMVPLHRADGYSYTFAKQD